MKSHLDPMMNMHHAVPYNHDSQVMVHDKMHDYKVHYAMDMHHVVPYDHDNEMVEH